jgi:2Fe-2S ferredoxin
MTNLHLFDREENSHQINLSDHDDRNLMEALQDEGFDVEGTCAGSASCGTCHIYVENNIDSSDPGNRTEQEDLILGGLSFAKENSRLACQIPVSDQLSGLTIRLAPEEF